MKKNLSLLTLGPLFAVAALIILVGLLGWLRPVGVVGTRIFKPVVALWYRLSDTVHPGINDGKSIGELQDQLSATQADNRRLLAENAKLGQITEENKTLRTFINFFDKKNITYEIAGVIARGKAGDSWQSQQVITLNRGSKQGLVAGMPIVDGEGILLGKLTTVSDDVSEACLLFDANCRIAVAVQNEPSTLGVVQSDLNLTTKVDFISQNHSVPENSILVSSGLEQYMPAGLVVGRVTAVIKEGNELWQHAIIQPLADFDSIRVVAVIK